MTKKSKKMVWGFSYLLSILIANLFVIWFGIVHFAGLTFPAGVVFVGLTFSFRDFVQREWGDRACWLWMILASILTTALSPKVALASFTAFLISEGVDWAAFKYLKYSFRKRIVISNLLSCPLDSIIFVTIAFGWFWPAIWGQALIKYLSGLLVLPFISKDKLGFYGKKSFTIMRHSKH